MSTDLNQTESKVKIDNEKSIIFCQLKLSPECLQIKTLENKNDWWGKKCKNCRRLKSERDNLIKITNKSDNSKKIVKNEPLINLNCELNLSSECLKVKTFKNKNEWWGTSCKKCRKIKSDQNILNKYNKRYIKKEDSNQIPITT